MTLSKKNCFTMFFQIKQAVQIFLNVTTPTKSCFRRYKFYLITLDLNVNIFKRNQINCIKVKSFCKLKIMRNFRLAFRVRKMVESSHIEEEWIMWEEPSWKEPFFSLEGSLIIEKKFFFLLFQAFVTISVTKKFNWN